MEEMRIKESIEALKEVFFFFSSAFSKTGRRGERERGIETLM